MSDMETTTYNELRTRINRHCPWLLELKFGYEIELEDISVHEGERPRVHACFINKENTNMNWFYFFDSKSVSFYELEDMADADIKILGIPPSLSDVLYAIDNSTKTGIEGELSFGATGIVTRSNSLGTYDVDNKNIRIDYSKSLKDQSEDLGQWLLTVIE